MNGLLLLLQETCYILDSRCAYYVVKVQLWTVVITEIRQQPLTSLLFCNKRTVKVTIVTNDNYKVIFGID